MSKSQKASAASRACYHICLGGTLQAGACEPSG